jgi:hypothetical protein
MSHITDISAEQNYAAGPNDRLATLLNTIKAARDPASFSSRHAVTVDKGVVVKEKGAAFDRTTLRTLSDTKEPIAGGVKAISPVGNSVPAAEPPPSPPLSPPPPSSPSAGKAGETTVTIPSEPAPSMNAPSWSKGAVVAAAGAQAASVAGPIIIKAAGEKLADVAAEEALAAQANSIEALRTPTSGVLVVTLKRTTLQGDPSLESNVTVNFAALYPVGGFATPQQAIGAVERSGGVSQNVQNSYLSSTYTWYPPITTSGGN